MDKNFDNEQDIINKYLFDETLSEEEMTSRQWKIIEAAIRVFSEKGFEGSRTSDIAREADVAEGTIFRYFKTKKDLLLGLLIPMTAKFFRPLLFKPVEKIMSNRENKPIEEVVEEILIDRLALIRKNLPLAKTVLIESSYHPELLEPIQREIAPKIVEALDGFMAEQIKSGRFRNLEPRTLTRSLMSLLMGYVILTGVFPGLFDNGDDKEQMKQITDIFLNGAGEK